MQCPLCRDAPLEPNYVGSTEVDICSRCRGIWLDRGELDRLLDGPTVTSRSERADRSGDPDRRDRFDDDPRGRREREPKRKSKAKRLADLFEDVLDL
jgi:Zn-finger nucleic acid-binding protein